MQNQCGFTYTYKSGRISIHFAQLAEQATYSCWLTKTDSIYCALENITEITWLSEVEFKTFVSFYFMKRITFSLYMIRYIFNNFPS